MKPSRELRYISVDFKKKGKIRIPRWDYCAGFIRGQRRGGELEDVKPLRCRLYWYTVDWSTRTRILSCSCFRRFRSLLLLLLLFTASAHLMSLSRCLFGTAAERWSARTEAHEHFSLAFRISRCVARYMVPVRTCVGVLCVFCFFVSLPELW